MGTRPAWKVAVAPLLGGEGGEMGRRQPEGVREAAGLEGGRGEGEEGREQEGVKEGELVRDFISSSSSSSSWHDGRSGDAEVCLCV